MKEKIKELLIEIKENPRKLLELEKYFVNDVVEVAIENELYESLMIAFQPITIDGEVKICLDAFSSNILDILKYSCDTKEQAEQEAKQEYDDIQERNSKLSDEDKEFFYNESTYEDILQSKRVIPKEIKDSIKKVLFTIDYEKISKMKIKNTHARQISGWNHPVETVEDVMFYSELPCLMASIDLFNRNIRTTMNDTAGVFEDLGITSGICTIWINYNALSEENKGVVEGLIQSGCAKRFMDGNVDTISLFVPCTSEDTVGEISSKLQTIVSKLKVQDIGYGFGTVEEVYQSYYPTIKNFPFYADGLFANGINIADVLELGQRMGDDLFYDEKEGLIWKSQELYQKHKRYLESLPQKQSTSKK